MQNVIQIFHTHSHTNLGLKKEALTDMNTS
jgi:hypothetical protein